MPRAKIDDPQVIAILMDAGRVRLLEPFMLRPLTVGQAAARRGMTAAAMGYWVRRFVDLGLLVREGTEAGGAARYRASASEYVFDPTHVVPLDEVISRQYAPTWQRMLGALAGSYQRVSPTWLLRLYVDENNLIHRDGIPEAALDDPTYRLPPMPLNAWGILRLDRDTAEAFHDALDEVFRTFSAKATEATDAPEYLVHIGMVRA